MCIRDRIQRVGITSGASTPEWLVDSITQRLDASQVCTVEVAEEKVTFALPKELRDVALPTQDTEGAHE